MGEVYRTKEKILDFVSAFCDQHGYSPSYREIAIGVGVKSTATVNRHIHDLIRNGVLPPVEQCPRKLTLCRKTKLTACAGERVQRIRLEAADGGVVCFDCNLKREQDGMELSFTGVLDATRLKCPVSRIVNCSIDHGEAQ